LATGFLDGAFLATGFFTAFLAVFADFATTFLFTATF
jgi:hypothetical protein